jgi:enoyl-[acyl-carrier protein] reductase II
VRHALRVEAEGADAIVASGTEGGGHVGHIATLPLVPQVVDAVKVPVIAAGGIGDGRGFLAALSLGAVGAQLGTRLICTPEAQDPGWYKEMILATNEEGTMVSKALTGKTTRAFATPEVRAYEEARLRGVSGADLKVYERAVRQGRKKGEEYEGTRQAVVGQICGMLRDESDIKPVAQVIEEMIQEAATLARRTAALI